MIQAEQQSTTHGHLSGAHRALWLIYNALLAAGALLMAPLLIPYVVATKRRRHTFLHRIGFRLGHQYSHRSNAAEHRIWIHALSVGEMTSAQPLVDRLSRTHPHIQVLLTASTLSGFETAQRLFGNLGIELAYFPYDWVVSIRAIASRVRPDAVILVETDIWPNFLIDMFQRRVPVYLVNMRLSDRAFQSYGRFKSMAGRIFSAFRKICVQTEQDAVRLRKLGVDPHRIAITGNIKFDQEVNQDTDDGSDDWPTLNQAIEQRKVMVAGSTHEGEEAILLKSLNAIEAQMEAPLLIIAPRNPERSAAVLALCRRGERRCCRLSELIEGQAAQKPQIVVVDFIGALKQLYGLADIAFVGGSMTNDGGHNPLEPAAWGKPVLFGPDMRDFHQIAAWLIQAGGARQASEYRLASLLIELLGDPTSARTMGRRAREVFLSHRGAVNNTLACLDLMPSAAQITEPES